MVFAIEDVIAAAGVASGGAVTYTRLEGGLSHRVIRVDTDTGPYVLRLLNPAVSEVGLCIPWRQEIENTERAARTGVGPRVFHIADDPPAMVLEYIDGATLNQSAVRRLAMIPRIAAACRRLHTGPDRFVNDFSIFRKAEELLARCRRHDLRIPDGYADYLPVVRKIEHAMEAHPLPAVPCHNDLLPENLMDDGNDIRIVDYQLSGMNDPAFELGDIAAEADFGPGRVEALAKAYFGTEMSDALLARVRLYLTASNFTWTLWFTIHHGMLANYGAAADFDYWAEAADKWGQAVRDLESDELSRLIDLVRGRG